MNIYKIAAPLIAMSVCVWAADSHANEKAGSWDQKQVSQSLALQAKTQYIQVHDNKIAFRTFGRGAPLILLNRFRGTLDTWDPLFLDLLAKKNTVIIFDQPGVGYSEGDIPLTMKELSSDVTGLADQLKIEKFNVMGWSFGGWVAQYVLFYNPSRVMKTVLIDNNAVGKNDIAMEPAFAKSAMKSNKDLGFEDYVTMFYEPKSEKSRVAAKKSLARIAKRLDNSKVPENPEVLNRYFAPIPAVVEDAENFRAAYANLKTPVLVISGDHDISFPFANWYPIIKKAPTTQFIVLPDAGHAPQDQYPELASGYINTFLDN